jgi:hypothetical protein
MRIFRKRNRVGFVEWVDVDDGLWKAVIGENRNCVVSLIWQVQGLCGMLFDAGAVDDDGKERRDAEGRFLVTHKKGHGFPLTQDFILRQTQR